MLEAGTYVTAAPVEAEMVVAAEVVVVTAEEASAKEPSVASTVKLVVATEPHVVSVVVKMEGVAVVVVRKEALAWVGSGKMALAGV